MLIHALSGLTASNQQIHTAIMKKNDEITNLTETMKGIQATLSETISCGNLYRGEDIVNYAGKNKIYIT